MRPGDLLVFIENIALDNSFKVKGPSQLFAASKVNFFSKTVLFKYNFMSFLSILLEEYKSL